MIDGLPIYQAEWDRLAKPYFEEVEAKAGRPLSEDERKLLRRNVLNELIRERLWLADARRRGIKVTEATIDARMKQSDFFRSSGRVDEAKFLSFKQARTSNYDELRGQVERTLLLEEYVRWMERRFGPREAELRKTFEERTSQASIRYFLLGPEAISLEPEASAAGVRAYYEAHPDEFESADEARLQYIRVGAAGEGAAADSAREAAAQPALKTATDILAAVKAGAPAETAAKPAGGVHDSGWFKLGDPIRGLGRSDALTASVRGTESGEWIEEPVRVGSLVVVARVERRPRRRLPLVEVLPQAKRKADALLRESVSDSLARAEVRLHPEAYYAPRPAASVVARGLGSFEAGNPPTGKEIEKRLERLRKDLRISDPPRAWTDSVRASLPTSLMRERRLASASRGLREAAARLGKREDAARVAMRHAAVLSSFQLYRGEPLPGPQLVEGALLDSLYALRPGDVVGPRFEGDSVFVVRVERIETDFMPPYAAVRGAARAAAAERRRDEQLREAQKYFQEHRGEYLTPTRWVLDTVFFRRAQPDAIPVSEESIAAYWRDHPLEFTEPGKARARHILVAARAGAAPSRAAARQKALAARKRIEAGEDFAAIAKEVSEDPSSAAKGGDLGEFTRGSVVKEFGDEAFTLPVGALSDPVETRFGFHVLRVEARTPERLRPIEECREEIRQVLGGADADSTARSAATALAAAASRPGASFDSLAAAAGGATRSGAVAPGAQIGSLGKATWLERVMTSLRDGGVTAEPIELPGGYLVARRVRELKPEQATFDEVRDRALTDSQRDVRRNVADSLDARFRAALRAGADPDTLFVTFGGLRVSRSFGRQGPIPDLARDPALARDSTFLSLVFASKAGTVLPPLEGTYGTLYAVVDEVAILPPTEFAKQRDTLLRELVDQRIDAWTARLRSKAPIRIHRKELQALLS